MTLHPRYLERLRIGGGYGDPKDGGANFDANGDIATDGDITTGGNLTVEGLLAAGTPAQALTNASGEVDGGRIQPGTVGADKLDAEDEYTVAGLTITGALTAQEGLAGHNRKPGVSSEGLLLLCHFESSKDENASVVGDAFLDWSGNGHHVAVYAQGVTVPGKCGRGAQFNGSTGYARTMTTGIAENHGGGPLTLAAWIKTTQYDADPRVLMGFVGGAPYYPYVRIALCAGKAQVRVRGDNSVPALVLDGTQRIDDGAWHCVAAVIPAWNAGGTVRLYVDGALDASAADTRTATSACSSHLYIATANGAAQFLSGTMDEVAVWKRTLSDDELRAFYLLQTEFTAAFGNQVLAGNLSVRGGAVDTGLPNTLRGVLSASHGTGGAAPGCLRLYSFDGTPWYLFVENDGTVRVHSALPTSPDDGAIVGTQT